jgi:DNA-directed RNA polymerase specialized sigma24 family protein
MDYAEAIQRYMPQIELAVDTFLREVANWRLEREDLIQDTALLLLERWDQWLASSTKGIKDMGGYAYRTASNTCCTAARKLGQDAISAAVRLPEDEEYD